MAARPQPQDHQQRHTVEVPVTICWDDDLSQAVRDAERTLDALRKPETGEPDPAKVRDAERALDEARDAAREKSTTYVFGKIGRRAWRALLEEHPPTEDQVADYRRDMGDEEARPDWNEDTFPAAAIAACCVSHAMSPEAAEELIDDLSDLEVGQLVGGCVWANSRTRVVDLGKGSARTASTG